MQHMLRGDLTTSSCLQAVSSALRALPASTTSQCGSAFRGASARRDSPAARNSPSLALMLLSATRKHQQRPKTSAVCTKATLPVEALGQQQSSAAADERQHSHHAARTSLRG